jgi:hypothetical protein
VIGPVVFTPRTQTFVTDVKEYGLGNLEAARMDGLFQNLWLSMTSFGSDMSYILVHKMWF